MNIDTKEKFIELIKRRLGHPVVTVNLAPEQFEDAVQMSLERFWDEHMHGVQTKFFTKVLTEEEASSKEFIIPDELGIDSIGTIIQVGNSYGVGEWHTVPWQTAYSTVAGASAYSTIRASDFTLLRQRLKTIRNQFNQPMTFSYNRHSKKVIMEMRLIEGQTIAMETRQNVDPNKAEFSDAWNNAWLQAYAVANAKKIWGDVLINLQGVKLAGGLEINGDRIYENAVRELEALELELRTKWSLPLGFMVG